MYDCTQYQYVILRIRAPDFANSLRNPFRTARRLGVQITWDVFNIVEYVSAVKALKYYYAKLHEDLQGLRVSGREHMPGVTETRAIAQHTTYGRYCTFGCPHAQARCSGVAFSRKSDAWLEQGM